MPPKRSLLLPLPALFEVAAAWLLALVVIVIGAHHLLDTLAEQEKDNIQEARIQVVLAQVRDSLEASLDLGFPITGLPRAQSLIEATLGKEPTLLALDVFDGHGIIRFSTDRGSIGEAVPREWLSARGSDTFSAVAGDDQVLAIALRGAFVEVEATLVATYRPGAPITHDVCHLPVALAALVLSALGFARVFLSPARHPVNATLAALSGAPAKPPEEVARALSRLNDYEQRFAQVFAALEQEDPHP